METIEIADNVKEWTLVMQALPKCWSSKEKYYYLGLSQNNLRVHYKGAGKNHKDAAAVRANHSVPPACGIYYYEVRIVSKGRDGYMGIGFSQQGVSLNRLPGWDKNSYGYHGDDGCSFCSTGQGRPYGPTFTTGDVIGCGLNLVDNTCFYTKNGQHLGTAFTDLPADLYPTVGLQTPGEIIDTNFGQSPFVYDIQQDLSEARARIKCSVGRFPVPGLKQDWLVKLVSDYLVHHGYHEAAASFCLLTDERLPEDLSSIKNRHSIQKLIHTGNISAAIEQLQLLHPSLLECNPDLLFMLKCRQFVEILAGNDNEASNSVTDSLAQRSSSCVVTANALPSTKSAFRHSPLRSPRDSPRQSPRRIKSPRHSQSLRGSPVLHRQPSNECELPPLQTAVVQLQQSNNSISSGSSCSSSSSNVRNGHGDAAAGNGVADSSSMDVVLDPDSCCDSSQMAGSASTFAESQNGCCRSSGQMAHTKGPVDALRREANGGRFSSEAASEDVEMSDRSDDGGCDERSPNHQLLRGNRDAVERLLQFGRDLQLLNSQLRKSHGPNAKNTKMLNDAFSLLAYSDPWKSPVSYQLDPGQRELIAAAVNRAMLCLFHQPARPSLEVLYSHAKRLRQEMAKAGFGSCAFVDPDAHLSACATSL